jgi:hypothetical protein
VLGESKSNKELRSVEWPRLSEYHVHAHKCSPLTRTPTLVAFFSRWVSNEDALHGTWIQFALKVYGL